MHAVDFRPFVGQMAIRFQRSLFRHQTLGQSAERAFFQVRKSLDFFHGFFSSANPLRFEAGFSPTYLGTYQHVKVLYMGV
jgi:hypothetical protein